MKNKKILILIGIPASGKTTWAKDFVKKNDKWVRVSRDDFRFMLKDLGKLDHKDEELISENMDNVIENALYLGYNVVIDNTHVKKSHINEVIERFKYQADIDYQVFDISLEKALERDKNRDKEVGEEVIRRMYNNYKILMDSFDFQPVLKKKKEYILPVKGENDAVIFDIDGTIALMENRGPFDWNKVDRDSLNWIVSEQMEYHRSLGRKIILVSGRSEECRILTEEWLSFHELNYDALFMRGKDDYRKDTTVKKEIYSEELKDSYNILCVYDDRLSVVSMWNKLGIFVFNVNQGMIKF